MMQSKNTSPYHNMTMAGIIAAKSRPNPEGINTTVTAQQSLSEGARNFAIQKNLALMLYRPFIDKTRVELPHDTPQSMPARKLEFQRQLVEPWRNVFMYTNTSQNRLNNPAQTSFVKQRRLTIPNTYGQFYAFMHALSAAFGQLS